MEEISKVYRPKEVEDRWYRFWEENKYFQPKTEPTKTPYVISIPPPNITGILHMGHALNNTLQDILIRWKRMDGVPTLWVPGTDHAGIATQNVVEQELARQGLRRQDLGREKFLERVWRWRDEYGRTIIQQLKKIGCSCDWTRERFTLDEGCSKAVEEVFIRLYKKGLIYRGSFIVNWCPRCQTALSDEEAQHEDIQGSLYYIKYPLKGSSYEWVQVATTRPETMLGDTAVAVNPRDKRYKKLVGKTLILPIIERELEIIADDIVDPKFGTGAVKVTPCHDPNDYEIGCRHGLKGVLVMNPDGTMNRSAGPYEGMDRFECREALLVSLRERGLLVKVVTHQHAVGHCYRCHTMIEPYFSEQWFVRMKPLAEPAIKVVEDGKIKFHPPRWKKVYLNWMYNIKDWCISRQIWWGHRIPAWFCKRCYKRYLDERLGGEISLPLKISTEEAGIHVARRRPPSCQRCGEEELFQDEDVLDTWFSSWLWPFSTLGWPEVKSKIKDQRSKTKNQKSKISDLDYFYPTSVLVTAPEILFFWVARMVMAGLEFVGQVPFGDVYIHGTVRDERGTKMSKSLGNIIDPLDIIEAFGTDALRFSIISITATGQDVFLSREKFAVGRNFANKVWNASRFVLMNLKKPEAGSQRPEIREVGELSLADKWILSRLNKTIGTQTASLENYRFNDAANSLYEFFWHEFCDWYLELAKPDIEQPRVQAILILVLEASLRMLHPFMPFLTEEIWQRLPHEALSIMVAPWPRVEGALIDDDSERNMDLIINEVTAIRNIRSDWQVPPKVRVEVTLQVPTRAKEVLLKQHSTYIGHLARAEVVEIGRRLPKPAGSATAIVEGVETYVELRGLIDLKKEMARISRELEKVRAELDSVEAKLKQREFLRKAPREVVKKEKARRDDLKAKKRRLEFHLKEVR